MKNMIEICKDFGIEIPAEKHAEFNKAVSENYKTVAEFEKKVSRLEAERDSHKERADTAEDALKGFDGIDPENVKAQLEEANKKIREAQESAQKQIDERDFSDALKAELDALKFTSSAARKSVEAEIRAAGLKHKNGKILGFGDLIDQIRKDDVSAFVDEQTQTLENNRAKFANPASNGSNGGTITKKDIMAIKDPAERQSRIAENLHLFKSKG